jgi:hypothetical protein
MSERKSVLLRLDPAVHDALARWAADEMRSTNAQIEFLLRRALAEAGRMPGHARQMRRQGRPSARPLARRLAAATRAGRPRISRTPWTPRTPLRRNRRATLDSRDLNTHGSSG